MKILEKEIQYPKATDINFDIDNPRGEAEHQILSDPEFAKLKISIKQFGILEPLIVKKGGHGQKPFVLIDGERRLRAAIEVHADTVPALIAKNDTDGRILAYQVHMLRKNWEKASETKSIKKIIADIKKDAPTISEPEMKKKLKEITAHKEHEIDDLISLCRYPDQIIEKVLSDQLEMSYLVQIESSFINPLNRKYPELVKKYGEDNVRQILAYKALNGLLVHILMKVDTCFNP